MQKNSWCHFRYNTSYFSRVFGDFEKSKYELSVNKVGWLDAEEAASLGYDVVEWIDSSFTSTTVRILDERAFL